MRNERTEIKKFILTCVNIKLMSEMCRFTGKRKTSESDGGSDKAKRSAPERRGKGIFTKQNS